MYLALLNDNEKENFLELAWYSIGVNGEYKIEEEEVFSGYKYECKLTDYEVSRQSEVKNIITVLSKSEKKIKKIILIELIGIFLADGEMCDKEVVFLDKVSDVFGISKYELKEIIKWVDDINSIVNHGLQLISRN